MKKIGKIAFIIIVFGVLVILGAGVVLGGNASDNEKQADKPMLIKEGQLNQNILDDVENYVTANFGFREKLIDTYSTLSQKLFHTSGVEDVILGDDGYLYYGDTTDDYLGIVTLSEREQYNIVRTLELMQENVESQNAQFLFVIAPNKNSLYDHMPYNYKKESDEGNADVLLQKLGNVNTVDLFAVFQKQEEELYHKLDSHWNNKGALLAYQAMLEKLNQTPLAIDEDSMEQKQDFSGDLYKMLYPSGTEKDWNYYSDRKDTYTYITRTRSVEQSYIETENANGIGSLLMFRDSFGNALLPYFADTYQYGVFDKSSPYDFRKMDTFQADTVIIEIAERNLSLLQENYPVFLAPLRDGIETTARESNPIGQLQSKKNDDVIAQIKLEDNDEYQYVSGTLQKGVCDTNSRIYIQIDNKYYELTPQSSDDSEYGFDGYFTKELDLSQATICVSDEK